MKLLALALLTDQPVVGLFTSFFFHQAFNAAEGAACHVLHSDFEVLFHGQCLAAPTLSKEHMLAGAGSYPASQRTAGTGWQLTEQQGPCVSGSDFLSAQPSNSVAAISEGACLLICFSGSHANKWDPAEELSQEQWLLSLAANLSREPFVMNPQSPLTPEPGRCYLPRDELPLFPDMCLLI